MLTVHTKNGEINHSIFSTQEGAEEHYITLTPVLETNFKQELSRLFSLYKQTLSQRGLSRNTQVFSRLFLSDIANQETEIKKSGLFSLLRGGAYSIIQQTPLQGGRVSLLSYHIKPSSGKLNKKAITLDKNAFQNAVSISGAHYKTLWTANISGEGGLNPAKQTQDLFRTMDTVVGNNKMTLTSHLIRTWLFVRDIDNHYGGMVRARKQLFIKKGLTSSTRYPASTGIEGSGSNPHSLVSMDALCVKGLQSEQIVKMEALKNLSPTIQYNVTFERGIKLVFGDRVHMHISGTASINHKGELLHPRNLVKQTERTLKNIQALLKPHGANFEDIACMVAYVRDPNAKHQVQEILNSALPNNPPLILVEAPVCRPGWLVELECVAIKKADTPYPDFI